jgi:hypothetical protein
VSEQELDLLQIAAILATELGTGPAKIVRAEVFDSNLSCTLLDNRSNGPVAQLVADHLPTLRERSQQTAFLNLGRYHPGVDCLLNLERNRHRSHSAALAAQIGHNPSPLAELDIVNVQAGQLLQA